MNVRGYWEKQIIFFELKNKFPYVLRLVYEGVEESGQNTMPHSTNTCICRRYSIQGFQIVENEKYNEREEHNFEGFLLTGEVGDLMKGKENNIFV